MNQLKEICLQVRYEGTPASFVHEFFEPVTAVSCQLRARIPLLGRASLLPISLGLSRFLATGNKIRLMIALPRSPASAKTGSSAPLASSFAPPDLHSQLRSIAPDFDEKAFPDLTAFATQIEVKIVSPNQDFVLDTESPSATVGFFTDGTGASVSYQADWSLISENESQSGLTASWSWGDPQFRVRKGIEKFEALWNDSDSTLATNDIKLTLLTILLHLEQTPILLRSGVTTLQLFPHQQNAVEAWMNRNFRGVFKMCTGAGKTISALAGVHALSKQRVDASQKTPPVLISVPTRVLADQWIREIKRFGFRSVIPAYNAFEQWSQLLEPTLRSQSGDQPRFVVTTYRTLADARFVAKLKRASDSGVEALWIADEMHNLSSPRLREAMKQVGGVFPFRLGLSATPEIEGDLAATEQLLGYFGNICASYELSDGIRDGVLCPYRYYPVPAYLAPELAEKYLTLLRDIDTSRAGSAPQMNLYRETRDLVRTSGVQVARFRDLLQDLLHSSPDFHHTLIYCPPGYGTYRREVSDEIDTDVGERRLIEEVIEVLRENGLSPVSILGETSAEDRTQNLRRFADGRVNALCAIGCLDEGVDVPSIQRAIVLYSIDREKQFIQRRGRILRQPIGDQRKVAEIYDIVVLPQGSMMPAAQAEALLNKELRRYRQFAMLALNRDEADHAISAALAIATHNSQQNPQPEYA